MTYCCTHLTDIGNPVNIVIHLGNRFGHAFHINVYIVCIHIVVDSVVSLVYIQIHAAFPNVHIVSALARLHIWL